MKYYLTIERKEILIHAMTWINIEDSMLSEVRQTKNTPRIFHNSTYRRYLE